MSEAWDCAKLVDGKVLRRFLFLFGDIDDLGFKLDVSYLKESQCSSAWLTQGMIVKSDRHILLLKEININFIFDNCQLHINIYYRSGTI